MQKNFSRIQGVIEDHLGTMVSKERLPSKQNDVLHIDTVKGKFVVKIYEQRLAKASPNREIQMSRMLSNLSQIRELVYADESAQLIPYHYAVYRYVEGDTLRTLLETKDLSSEQVEDIVKQIHSLISDITEIRTQGFGRIEEGVLKGGSLSWVEFLKESQKPTIDTFRSADLIPETLYLSVLRILDKHEDRFQLASPRLLPMDLNVSNLVLDVNAKIKLIDLKTFWSGDPLCAKAQFYSLTNGTIVGEAYRNILNLNSEDEFKFRFYALSDNLNVLAYIARSEPSTVMSATPWANRHKFIDLIKQNVEFLGSA